MRASDYVASFLVAQGVRCVFEVIGGMITHLVDSCHRQNGLKVVSVHHEQAAAFAADGFGRITGIPGVALATSGPGAINLLTGVGSSYFDSSPAVFITGQVNRNEQKGDRAIRQLGFQEADIVTMAQPITKAAWKVEKPEELPQLLEAAFKLAISGRPGPVLLDIPMDVQRAEIQTFGPEKKVSTDCGTPIDPVAITELLNALNSASRPLILAGGGVRSAQAVDLFREFVGAVNIPVVTSLLGLDVLPYNHPLRAGFIGSYGNRWANLAVGSSDLLLVLGSRLDIRQTGSDTEAFKKDRLIFHVDCEAGEMNNRIRGCTAIRSHLYPFLVEAICLSKQRHFPAKHTWAAEIDKLRIQWPDILENKDRPGINPNRLMHELSEASTRAAAFVTDVGQHQMWAAQSLDLQGNQRFLTSGGMGAMGFGLPAAVGTAMANPGTPVVVIAGDGGFQLNIQELQTVVRNNIPLKIVVINNQCHGMVRQFQQSYFDERYHSTYWGYSAPSFARLAHAYGIESLTVESQASIASALDLMWADPSRPFLLEVMVDTLTNVYPKIAFGHPFTEMEPFAKPIAMEGT